MFYFIQFLIVVAAFIGASLVTGLIGGLLYFVYLPFKKKLLKSGKLNFIRSRQINKAYILLLFIIACSQTYFAFFPTDSFYEDEFISNTGIQLPSSAEIITKDSDYPDIHGDYWAAAVIELDGSEFSNLKNKIQQSKGFQIGTTTQKIGITREYDNLTKDIDNTEIDVVFSNINEEWFKVAFLKNKKTIIFERSSS